MGHNDLMNYLEKGFLSDIIYHKSLMSFLAMHDIFFIFANLISIPKCPWIQKHS